MSRPASARWDIFCKVIDHYGDAGVCWRLARQLAAEHRIAVRIYIDNINIFNDLSVMINADSTVRGVPGVEIHPWSAPFPAPPQSVMPDVVIEAFACDLPELYVVAMAAQTVKPLWLNLEYLSAENWVDTHHGLASPHPRLPLVKHFFFPGFSPATGGLLCEHGLLERRNRFLADSDRVADFWRLLGLPPPVTQETRVSLFGYPGAPLEALLEQWAVQRTPCTVLVPTGVFSEPLSQFFGRIPAAGDVASRGDLTVKCFPFLAQDGYDQLLWACDLNFVRGEDSFVRAQWAGKPFVWQIYQQADHAHRPKLEAFLARYLAGLPAKQARQLSDFWLAWNGQSGLVSETWPPLYDNLDFWAIHARAWPEQLNRHGDLAGNLLRFCRSMRH